MGRFRYGLVVLMILLAACASSATPMTRLTQVTTPEFTVQVIQEDGTHREVVQTDVVEMPNCGGSGEMEASIERSRSIRHEVALETGLEVSANGKAEILGTGIDVGAAVAAKYGTTYGAAEVIKRSLNFKVKEGTSVRYDFQLVEIWKPGILQIRMGDQEQQIPYWFRQDFALEAISSQDLGCPPETPSGGGVSEATVQVATEISTAVHPLETPISEAEAGDPWFGPTSFCLRIDATNRCINETDQLPAGTTKFYVSWEFNNIPDGAHFERIWYRDGNRLKYIDDTWDSAWGSPTGVEYTHYQYNPGFANGEYWLELYINGALLQTGSASIGP